MREVFVVGVGQTVFGKHLDRSHRSLALAAIDEAFSDVGVDIGAVDVGHVVFGSCAVSAFGQGSARGVHVLGGDFIDRHGGVAVTDVEAACATGFVAFDVAASTVEAGADVVVAVGVDKTFLPDPAALPALFAGALDQLEPAARRVYDEAAAALSTTFSPHPARLVTLDVCALLALHGLQTRTTTTTAWAEAAARSHAMAAQNPKATPRGPVSADAVAADKVALAPLTRSMCTGLADGAAAAVVVSGAWLAQQPSSVQARAVRVVERRRRSGSRTSLSVPSVTARLSEQLEHDPGSVDVAEVHDATSCGGLAATHALGLLRAAVNTSGGLVGKGHPLAATGLGMVREIVLQLRGEAGARQVDGARRGLVHNAGGFAGLDEAVVGLAVFDAVAGR